MLHGVITQNIAVWTSRRVPWSHFFSLKIIDSFQCIGLLSKHRVLCCFIQLLAIHSHTPVFYGFKENWLQKIISKLLRNKM